MKYIGAGEDSILLVFSPAPELIPDDAPGSCVAIPYLSRAGGIFLAIPRDYLLPEVLASAEVGDEDDLLGPNKTLTAPLLEEDDAGNEVRLGIEAAFTMIDFAEVGLALLREYDPVIDPSSNIQPFSVEYPQSIVDLHDIGDSIKSWLDQHLGGPRLNFYSARDEQEVIVPKANPKPKPAAKTKITTAMLAQQVSELASQMKALATQQEKLIHKQTPRPPAIRVDMPKPGAAASSRVPSEWIWGQHDW